MSRKIFENFNFSLLNDPRFKEESVREELIAPLIRYLGYTNSGNTQVIRNHGLKHPYVSIGSTKKSITIIPDYLLKVWEKPAWVLEAKSPSESINQTKHAEQAYSYAIHPEIRTNYFALCNGKEFALYNVNEEKPMLYFPMQVVDQHKEFLKELLEPSKVLNQREFKLSKDLGLHMKRIGFTPSERVLILLVQPLYIVKYSDNLFSFPSPVGIDEQTYVGSFDFDKATANKLRPFVSKETFAKLMQPVTDTMLQFYFGEKFFLNVSISLPAEETLYENDKEIYLPLTVNDFLTF